MSRRTYNQYCGLAHALDLIGERWTLLIVRELLTGPKRYTELQDHLPGIGTNLLADRLSFLVEEDIVEKDHAYRLTEYGRRLDDAVIALARWGLQSIGQPADDDFYAGSWSILAMHAVFRPDLARGHSETYEYRIGDEAFHASIEDGRLETSYGRTDSPAFILHATVDSYKDLVAGKSTVASLQNTDGIHIEGDIDAFRRSLRIFGLDRA